MDEDRLSNHRDASLDESTDTLRSRRTEREVRETDRQTVRHMDGGRGGGRLLEAPEWSDEGEGVFPRGLDGGHVQGDAEGGDAQLVALFVRVNPEVLTPDGSVDPAPWVLYGDLSVNPRGGGAWLAPRVQQRSDPTVLNLCNRRQQLRCCLKLYSESGIQTV